MARAVMPIGWHAAGTQHPGKSRRPAVPGGHGRACFDRAKHIAVESAAERTTAAGDSAHVCQGLAVDARLTLEIVDRDVAVIPRQPGSDAETLGQLDHALLGKPCLGGGAVFPQVDTSGPAIAVK